MTAALERKHLLLLCTIALVLAVQPFAHGFVLGFVLFDVLVAVSIVVVLLVVFEGRREKMAMLALAIPAIVSNGLLYFLPQRHHELCAAVYYGLAAVFFGAAVVVILQDTFKKEEIVSDQIIAGMNGFLIAGVAWGNLYLLVDALSPGAFTLTGDSAAELGDVHLRRFEFNLLSFATLTGVSYDNLVPVGRVARTLNWMEGTFTLFYMAVVVGLLVGLRMEAPAPKPRSSAQHDPPDAQ